MPTRSTFNARSILRAVGSRSPRIPDFEDGIVVPTVSVGDLGGFAAEAIEARGTASFSITAPGGPANEHCMWDFGPILSPGGVVLEAFQAETIVGTGGWKSGYIDGAHLFTIFHPTITGPQYLGAPGSPWTGPKFGYSTILGPFDLDPWPVGGLPLRTVGQRGARTPFILGAHRPFGLNPVYVSQPGQRWFLPPGAHLFVRHNAIGGTANYTLTWREIPEQPGAV